MFMNYFHSTDPSCSCEDKARNENIDESEKRRRERRHPPDIDNISFRDSPCKWDKAQDSPSLSHPHRHRLTFPAPHEGRISPFCFQSSSSARLVAFIQREMILVFVNF